MENTIFALVFIFACAFLIVVLFAMWWQDRRERKAHNHIVNLYMDLDDAPTPRVDRVEDAGRLQ